MDFKDLESDSYAYSRSKAYYESETFRDRIDRYRELIGLRDSYMLSILSIDRALGRYRQREVLHSESLEGYQTSGPIPDDIDRHENRIDVGGETPLKVQASTSVAPKMNKSDVLELNDFFSRPVDIYSASVSVGSNMDATLDVWSLYTSEPSVRAKLRNVGFLRGDMHVRIAISGTPFHYGKVLAAYIPFAKQNIYANRYLTSGAVHRYECLAYFRK